METRWAATTVRSVLSVSEPSVALMVVVPALSVVARSEPSTLAIAGEDELQVTPPLRSELVPSVYVAVATNC